MVDQSVGSPYDPISLGGLTSSNCCYLAYRSDIGNYVVGGRIALSGASGGIGQYPVRWTTPQCTNGVPVIDDLANVLEVGQCFNPVDTSCTNQLLRKCGPGTSEIWRETISPDTQWTLARDVQSHLYVAGTNGMLAQYDTDGVLIWSNNFGHSAIQMAVGSSGHRFVSFDDGSIAELQSDPAPQAPLVVNDPQPATVFVGSNVTLSVTATGGAPLHYQWLQNGSAVAAGTTSALNFPSAVPSQSGSYTVVVTNTVGSVTSAPALLRVKMVELYFGSQLLTNGTYTFTSPPSLSIRSAFASGSSFYTLDGSAPTFASTYYTGPFTLTQSATVQAIGYSSDFSQSELADPINAVVLVQHTLTTSTPGGGSISLNPPGGTYLSTNVVTASAVPASGYSFLYWEGDASGSNPSVSVPMERNKFLQAVFGTSLSTTVAGSGQILLYPPAGPYPYGSIVRLTAVPQAGDYFGAWGNAASGNTNPLYFTISSPTPTVSSIFGSTPAGQAALTVEVTGGGRVTVNPRANAYTVGQVVTLTAMPDPGQSFTNWTGDATGTTNPLNVSMNQAKVITANFTARPTLSATRPGLEGFTPDGFRFTLLSAPQTAWQILSSSNFSSWQTLGTVSNAFGEVQFTDPGALNHSPGFYKATPAP